MAEHSGDLGWRTFVADLKLPGRKLIFSILKFWGDDSAAQGAVQVLAALPGIAAGFGMASRTHHCHA